MMWDKSKLHAARMQPYGAGHQQSLWSIGSPKLVNKEHKGMPKCFLRALGLITEHRHMWTLMITPPKGHIHPLSVTHLVLLEKTFCERMFCAFLGQCQRRAQNISPLRQRTGQWALCCSVNIPKQLFTLTQERKKASQPCAKTMYTTCANIFWK